MSKITASSEFDRADEKEVMRLITIWAEQVAQTVNGKLDLASNFNGVQLSVAFSAANTNVQISHGLNRAPIGYIVTKLSASMIVYDGTSANTGTTLNLRSSAAGTAGVFVY